MLSDSTDKPNNDDAGSLLAKKRSRRITFEMDAKKHSKIRMAAVSEDRLVKEILNEAVDDWLAKHNFD